MNLLELIQIRVLIEIMKLVEYKHLSENLKQLKQLKKKIKRTRRQNKKIDMLNNSIK